MSVLYCMYIVHVCRLSSVWMRDRSFISTSATGCSVCSLRLVRASLGCGCRTQLSPHTQTVTLTGHHIASDITSHSHSPTKPQAQWRATACKHTAATVLISGCAREARSWDREMDCVPCGGLRLAGKGWARVSRSVR